MMSSYGIIECISPRPCISPRSRAALLRENRTRSRATLLPFVSFVPYEDEEIKEQHSSDMNPQFPKRCPVYHDDGGCEWCDNMYIKPCSRNCKCIAFACYIEAVTKQRTAAISKAMMRPIKTSLNDRIVALVHEAVSKNQ